MKWRSLVLAFSIVASTIFAQGASYNGEWQGKYSCGPALHRTGPGTAAFSVNVTLRVNGTKAAMVREDAAAREVTEGMVTADGALGLQGTGRLTAGNSTPWRTRFEGKFRGSAFSATGVIDSTNGATKFRECTLALQRASPVQAAGQTQSSPATNQPPTIAPVSQNSASANPAAKPKPPLAGTDSAGKAAQVTIPATGVKTPDVIAVPPLTGRVTDLTNTLSSSQRQSLEAGLAAFEKKNGSQIAVLMLPSTQPETIEEYSMRVAERWKVGRAKVDDGLILIIAKNDHRLRIEVGYGLEGTIPDVVAKRIIREVIAPRLKEDDFFGGIRDGSHELMTLVESASLTTSGERVGRQSTIAKASSMVPAATQAQSTVTTPSQAPTQSTDLPGPESKGKDLTAQATLLKSVGTAGSASKPESIESSPSVPGERALATNFDRKALLLAALAGAGIVGLVVFIVARLRRRSTTRPSEKHTAADKSAVPPVEDLQSGLVDNKTKLVEGAQALSPNAAGTLQQADVHLAEHPPSPREAEVRDERPSGFAAERPTEKAAQMVIKHELTSRGVEGREGISEGEARGNFGEVVNPPTQSIQATFSVSELGPILDNAARLQNAELPDLPPLQHDSGPNPSPRDSTESVSTSVHDAEKMESFPAAETKAKSIGGQDATTTGDQNTSEISETWKRRFSLIEKAGGHNSWFSMDYDKLTTRERWLVGFNWLAFLFGPIYYVSKKGMQKKGQILFSFYLVIGSVLLIIDKFFALHTPVAAWGVLYVGFFVVCSAWANHDYYMYVVHNETIWNQMAVLDKAPLRAAILLAAIGFSYAAGKMTSVPECSDSAVVGLVKEIAKEQLGNTGLPQEAISRLALRLDAIRKKDENTKTKAITCVATLHMVGPAGDREADITYTAELTDEPDQIYVTVYGL